MKRSLLLILLLITVSPMAFAQIDLMLNYNYSRPQKEMATFIREAHGINMQGLYRIPQTLIAVGTDLGYSEYGRQTTRQTYRFSDGSSTDTDVRVSNSFFTFNVVGRLDLLKSGAVIPYIMGKTGYNLYWTNLYIENPDDPDGCQPLENKSLQRDGAFSLTGGAGIRWDLGTVIKSVGKERFYVDLSAHYTQGGRVSYMNVNIPSDPDPVAHQHQSPRGSDVASFNAKFINPVNQVVHEHHVGDVYTSPIQLMEFKLSFLYRLTY